MKLQCENLHFTENKIHFRYYHFLTNKQKTMKTLRNKYHYIYIKLTIYVFRFFSCFFFFKLCFGLGKAWELSVLFILIFAHFEFDSVIYRNF